MRKLRDLFKSKSIEKIDSVITKEESLKDYVQNTTITLEDLYRKGNLFGDNSSIKQPAQNSYLIYKCSQVWSEYVPQVDLKFYNKSDDEQVFKEHNEAINLLSQPNDEQTWYEFLSRSILFYTLYGESFWYWKDNLGSEMGINSVPDSLLIMNPLNMIEILDEYNDLKSWNYSGVHQGKELQRHIPKNNIIQVKNSNPYNDYRGIQSVKVLSDVIGVDYKSTVEVLRFYDNFAMPGSIITAPIESKIRPEDMKSYVNKFNSLFKGSNNKYKTAGFTGGIDIKTVGVTHDKQQLIELKNWVRDTALAVMNVPHTYAGYMGANRAEAEQQAKNFWQGAKSLLKRYEMTINNKILSRMDNKLYCKFDYDSIEALKPQIDSSVAQLYMSMGYTANDIVELFNVDLPSHDGITDRHFQPFNLIEVGTDDDDKQTNSIKEIDKIDNVVSTKKHLSKKGMRQSFLSIHKKQENAIKKNLYNYFTLQRSKILKIFKKHNTSEFNNFQKNEVSKIKIAQIINDLRNIFDTENNRIIERLKGLFTDTTKEGQKLARTSLGLDRNIILNTKIINDRLNLIVGINDTAFNRIKKQIFVGVNEGETINQIAARVHDIYSKDINLARSKLIARTETSAIINKASVEEYKVNGVQEKIWIATNDDKTRDDCRRASAQGPIPIDGSFHHGLTEPSAPNCRCTIAGYIR